MSNKEFPNDYFAKSHNPAPFKKEDLDRDLAAFKSTLVSFVKALPPNAKILDAGCGVGKAMRIILAYRPDVEIVGIDISDVSKFLPPKAKFHKMGVEDIGEFFGESVFDAIICQHVIEHLLYPIGMMENFKKVLKPGGKVFIETPNWSRLLVPTSPIFFWNDYTHVRIFTKAAMERLLSDFGFEIDTLKTVSSAGFVVKGDSFEKVETLYAKNKKYQGSFVGSLFGKVYNRFMNLFIEDILIAVGVNRK